MKTRSFVLAIVCALAVPAAAQTPNQVQADKFFAEGRDLLVNHKDAKGACVKFEQAIALDPTAPGVMLNLGLCYELQEKYATSLYWFRKAQFAAAEADPPLPEYEEAAKQHTQDLAGKVVLARIDVAQAPTDVRVSIDGRPVRPADYLRLEVDKDSVIEARAANKQLFRQAVELEPEVGPDGRQKAKDIIIVMQDEVLALRDPGKRRRQIAYGLGATGVVLWGVTLWFALDRQREYEEDQTTEARRSDIEKQLRYLGTGMFVAGTAAVGTAVYLYLTAPKAYRERVQQAVTPIVTPDQIGIGYARAF